jgi:YVTN family beta-propeller protein
MTGDQAAHNEPSPGKKFLWKSGPLARAPVIRRSASKTGKCSRLAEVYFIPETSSVAPPRMFSSIYELPLRPPHRRRLVAPAAALITLLLPLGCHRNRFPDVPDGYREFAYVTNGASNTVSVLDLVYMRQDRTLQVGAQPTGVAANPARNEVYVVNAGTPTGNGSVSVIDTNTNRVVATIPVHKQPFLIDVDAAGHRAYVANSGSNTVSVLDLDQRHEIGVVGTGEQPGLARISPDMRSLVVTNRRGGSVSIFAVTPYAVPAETHGLAALPGNLIPSHKTATGTQATQLPHLRGVFPGCPGATDAVILHDSSKAFIACSGGHQVMVVSLAAAPDSLQAKQDPSLLNDHLLTLLDVGNTPVQLALKPDDGEIFCSNFGSGSFSEIETGANEVAGTYPIGNEPAYGIVSADNSTLWVSDFGADSVNVWSIDDGMQAGIARVPTGPAPDALTFSADEHLLLAADAHSGDVSVIRTADRNGPALFTILPAGGSPNAIAVKAMQGKP